LGEGGAGEVGGVGGKEGRGGGLHLKFPGVQRLRSFLPAQGLQLAVE
jgi:hypothetical protein